MDSFYKYLKVYFIIRKQTSENYLFYPKMLTSPNANDLIEKLIIKKKKGYVLRKVQFKYSSICHFLRAKYRMNMEKRGIDN